MYLNMLDSQESDCDGVSGLTVRGMSECERVSDWEWIGVDGIDYERMRVKVKESDWDL